MTDPTSTQQTAIYDVDLVITHPTEDPDRISSEFGLQPGRAWKAGQIRTAPNGAPLPAVKGDTRWVVAERVQGHRRFFETAVELIDKLEAAEDYIRGLLASGGQAMLVVSLPGFINIGDVIKAADLLRMGRLGVELGVEVFPNLQ